MAVRSTANQAGVAGLVFKKVVKEEDPNIPGAPGVYMAQVGINITPASVAAAICADQTFTDPALADLDPSDFVAVSHPALANSASPVAAKCSAAGVISIRFCNPTAGALTPSAGVYQVLVVRIE